MKIKSLIITGFGINSDRELVAAFERAGSEASRVHINDLISRKVDMHDYQIMGFPGGFSFGDHIGSGKVFANKMRFKLGDDIKKFVDNGKPVIGICNGFQVLVKMGLLPGSAELRQTVTLSDNNSGKFEDRWVTLGVNEQTPSLWLKGIKTLEVPVRHGEGCFIAKSAVLDELKQHKQDALFYVDSNGCVTMEYPLNPNNSCRALAGITNVSGNVLGLMPHPEAFMFRENHPLFGEGARGIVGDATAVLKEDDGAGMTLFYNAVGYAQKNIS